jgi:hypothetical protein
VPEHFAPCPYCYFTFLNAGNIFLSLEQDLLRAVENSGKVSNKKCKEKLPEIHRMGRESPGLRHFQQLN